MRSSSKSSNNIARTQAVGQRYIRHMIHWMCTTLHENCREGCSVCTLCWNCLQQHFICLCHRKLFSFMLYCDRHTDTVIISNYTKHRANRCADSIVIRDAPFDFWGGGGGARLLLSVMLFFSEKIAHIFFLFTDLETKKIFVPGKKIKHFFCDSSYLIKYVDKCHALTLMKVSLRHTYSNCSCIQGST